MIRLTWLIAVISFICVIPRINLTEIKNHLGTRTPYRFKYNKNATHLFFPNCIERKIWMLTRHGTRNPSPKDIIGMDTTLKELKNEILINHNMGRGSLTKEQIERFEDWSNSVSIEFAKDLSSEGEEEMILLAERMQKRFPNIIKSHYDNKTFHFRHTATQRAQQSAKYFAIGLFNRKNALDVFFSPATKVDAVLRFYKHCDKWKKQVKKNETTYQEKKLYGLSQEINNTLEAISKRLGLKEVITLDEANLMYKICGFEIAWDKYLVSPWCYPFHVEDAEKLEYYNDLHLYWVDGYGHELTYRQACLAIKTMFKTFSKNKSPNATFLFAHSGTLLKIMSHLQLYRPESHLRGDTVNKDRTWRASDIDCFASNLAFVLYSCDDGDRVLTLHQENIIKLPMCDEELCPLEKLKEYFHESIYNCDYSDMCSLNKKTEL